MLRAISVQHLPQEYFNHFRIRFTCGDFTTSWQRLEKRLVNGYTILVNLFDNEHLSQDSGEATLFVGLHSSGTKLLLPITSVVAEFKVAKPWPDNA